MIVSDQQNRWLCQFERSYVRKTNIYVGFVICRLSYNVYLLNFNRDLLQLIFFNQIYNNFTKEKIHKPPLIWPLLVRQVYYSCNHNRWDRSPDSVQLKPLRKTYRRSSSEKPNKPQILLKIKIALLTSSFWPLFVRW
jgi:hypothetical protein